YTVTNDDLGSRVRCREVATNGDGSDSAVTGSLRVDTAVPANVDPPVLGGTQIAGHTMTCSTGIWTHQPHLQYEGLSGRTPIPGADGQDHVAQQSERNTQVGCRVTGRNALGASAPALSSTVLAVGDVPTSLTATTVTRKAIGSRLMDQELTCTPGTWYED